MKTLVATLFLIGLLNISNAQVIVTPSLLNHLDVHPDALLKGVVSSDGQYNVRARAELKLSNGELVLSVVSDPFRLSKGMNSLERITRANQMVYGTSIRSKNLKTTKQLDTGDYEFCIYIESSDGLEISADACIPVVVENLLFLDLIDPLNDDSIETRRPTLAWSVSGMQKSIGGYNYRITLKPILPGQSVVQAFAENQAIFSMEKTSTFMMPFPSSITPLEYGKSYCWAVEVIKDGVPQIQSETWKFSIKPPLIEKELKYAVLRKGLANDIYNAPNNRVYLSINNGYASSNILLRLVKEDGTQIEKFTTYEEMTTGKSSIISSEGSNLYKVDLQELNLDDGLYTLYVFNDQNDEFKLVVKLGK